MRGNLNRGVRLPLLLAAALLLGADAPKPKAQAETDDGLDVYFRDADLTAIADQPLEHYGESEPGESRPLERAFPGAPPQIPHVVDDTDPLALDANDCLECHHPDNVTEKDEVPMSASHFERAVMAAGHTGEGLAWKVAGYEKGKNIGVRFNCTMCHTPQAADVRTPASRFVREPDPRAAAQPKPAPAPAPPAKP